MKNGFWEDLWIIFLAIMFIVAILGLRLSIKNEPASDIMKPGEIAFTFVEKPDSGEEIRIQLRGDGLLTYRHGKVFYQGPALKPPIRVDHYEIYGQSGRTNLWSGKDIPIQWETLESEDPLVNKQKKDKND